MKRAIALILSLIMALSLVACGTPAAPDNTNTSDSEENNDPYTIAVVVKITGIAWYERMQVGIDKFNADTGNDAYITGASTADAAEQVAVIEDLIAQGVDALVVIPNSAEAVESVLAKAREQGIVVICHEGSDVQNATFTNYVGYLTSTSHNEWTDAEAALQAEKYPDMTLVSPKNETSEDSDTAYTKTKELLKAYPNLTGFLGSAMADVPGVARAVEEAGLEDSTYVVGTCLVSTAEQFLENGSIDVITFWDPADAGYALCELATKVLNGETISGGVSLTPDGYQNLTLNGKVLEGSAWISVTKDNMGDYNF